METDVSVDSFIVACQTSETIEEVVEKTGLHRKAVHQRLYRYRALGIPIRDFPIRHRERYTPERIAELKELAELTLQQAKGGA